jgi:tetratricopeptide (TPR) repeat protein
VADTPRIEELKRRVQSDPASIAFAALAEEYRRAGRFDEAIETCTTGLVRHPSYLSAHVTLGRALIEVGRLQEARTELEYVLKLAPENLAAIRGLAEIHNRIGDEHVEHVEHAAEAVESSPPAPVAMDRPEPEPAPAPASIPRIPLKVRVDVVDEQPRDRAATGGFEGRSESPVATPVLSPIVARTVEPSAPPNPHPASPRPVDPALAGLEEFLNAIVRARSQRPSVR